MPTGSFAAVGGTWGKTSVAFTANLLVALVLGGEYLHGGFDDATAETEDKVKGGFLLDIVIAQRSAILELLSSEDQALLVGGDPFLVLNFGLYIVDRV